MDAKSLIIQIFDRLLEPQLKWNINALNLLKVVEVHDEKAYIVVHLITQDKDQIESFKKEAMAALALVFSGKIDLRVSRAQVGAEGVDGVQKIIMVASGKGGVGKSTVAVNLAAALSQLGFAVGLMDADIYGPSIAIMLGTTERPEVLPEERLMPVKRHGICFISAGSLTPPGKALDWRGQLVSGTLVQFVKQTCWGALDFLIVDMPPGTGDAQLTLASKLRTNGVILVTTPQEVVWGDVRRAMDLFQKQEVPLLGLVENMAYQFCEACGHHNHPFVDTHESDTHGPLSHGVPILARLPLAKNISIHGDDGVPIVFGEPESEATIQFMMMAKTVASLTQASPMGTV